MKLNVHGHLKYWLRRLARTQVQLWYNRFQERHEDVNDDAVLVANENIKAVKKMILNNRRITNREVADDVGIPFGSCQVIFTDVLGMKRTAAKIVPKLLKLLLDIAQ